jgi:transcriptional regulator with XRE-family HTH domain
MRRGGPKTRQRVVLYDGPDPIDVFVGRRMPERRLLQGLTQEAIAAQIGVRLATIQKYEAARRRISASVLYGICQALDVQPDYFFAVYKETGSDKAGKTRQW